MKSTSTRLSFHPARVRIATLFFPLRSVTVVPTALVPPFHTCRADDLFSFRTRSAPTFRFLSFTYSATLCLFSSLSLSFSPLDASRRNLTTPTFATHSPTPSFFFRSRSYTHIHPHTHLATPSKLCLVGPTYARFPRFPFCGPPLSYIFFLFSLFDSPLVLPTSSLRLLLSCSTPVFWALRTFSFDPLLPSSFLLLLVLFPGRSLDLAFLFLFSSPFSFRLLFSLRTVLAACLGVRIRYI